MKINPTLCSSARPGSAPSLLLGIPKRLFVPCFSGETMGWGRSVGEPPWPPPALPRAEQRRQLHLHRKTLSVGQKGEKKRGLQIAYLRRRLCRALFSQDKGRGPGMVTAPKPPAPALPRAAHVKVQGLEQNSPARRGGRDAFHAVGRRFLYSATRSIHMHQGWPFLPRNNAAPLFPASQCCGSIAQSLLFPPAMSISISAHSL